MQETQCIVPDTLEILANMDGWTDGRKDGWIDKWIKSSLISGHLSFPICPSTHSLVYASYKPCG